MISTSQIDILLRMNHELLLYHEEESAGNPCAAIALGIKKKRCKKYAKIEDDEVCYDCGKCLCDLLQEESTI